MATMTREAWTDERLDDLAQRMEQRFDEVDRRMDERFMEVDRRMEGRFERVDERFERVDERFADVDRRLSEMNERFAGLETTVERGFAVMTSRWDRLTGVLIVGLLGLIGTQL